MFQVLVVSHGGLADAFLKSAEMIAGEQEEVKTLGIYPGESPEELYARAEAILNEWRGQSVIVMTDIMAGTPFNTVARLMERYRFRHICGINLAMLVEVIMNRECMEADEAADEVMSIYPRTIIDANALLTG